MDNGKGRYFGTLFGVMAVLKSKGLAGSEDMNDLVAYADLATEEINKVSALALDIAYAAGDKHRPPFDSLLRGVGPNAEDIPKLQNEFFEAVETLESMGGPTEIINKLVEGVLEYASKRQLNTKEDKKSKFKMINGGKPLGDESDDNG